MQEELLEFRSWRIWHDPELSRQIYAEIPQGSPEDCGCDECLRFARWRDSFYSPELKDLLERLGIDFQKEAEIVTYTPNPPDTPFPPNTLLEGWYHFAGRIEAGEDKMHYLDGDFQLEVSSQGALVPKQFGSLPVVKVGWQWPVKDPRLS